MTGHIYRDVILEQHVCLFRGAMSAEFIFMDDNARPHRANIVDECLQSDDITRMEWPAYSPDLNLIEHCGICLADELQPVVTFERITIVRVHYFVRGGSVGHRSRASSKHLSPHLPVDQLDSSGGQTGVALHLQMHVWVSGPQRKDVDVSEK
ncbi:DDE_3 domain-containing protein [Trichonephila clavipes]|nr:DDE_3 domain-containing protein [Trichonephila clavipes]